VDAVSDGSQARAKGGYGRNYVEYNELHHVCLEGFDSGAIFSWMQTPEVSERSGHVLRFNNRRKKPANRWLGKHVQWERPLFYLHLTPGVTIEPSFMPIATVFNRSAPGFSTGI
jgi:hypothetical protein